jgi:saccharopine dehydrogenase-like NADP-dependent oxidoreductase
MSHIAIVGLGQMGSATLRILLEQLPDATFLVLDRAPAALMAAERLDPGRVGGRTTDVIEGEVDLDGVDLVINLSGPFFAGADTVARAALRSGTTYIDIGDDLEATDTILRLDAEAKAAGVAMITGAGWSPGVSNWLAARLIDENPTTDGVQVVWVTHESDPGGLAPLRHMLHMAVSPCPVWVDGAWTRSPGFVPETAATYDFPEPLGATEAYDTAHPEPMTLSRHFPQLRYASCKGSLRPAWANAAFSTLGKIGFGYTDVEVEVEGVRIQPAEFLWKMMWARYELRPTKKSVATTALLVQALDGRDVLGTLAITDDAVMSRGTGLGAAVAALVALREPVSAGAWGPEVLPWSVALPEYERIGKVLGGFGPGVQALDASAAR